MASSRGPRSPRASRPPPEGAAVAAERLRTAALLEILNRSTAWLQGRGVDSPRLDAEILLAHALKMERLQLYLQFERPLLADEIDRARALMQRRGKGEPVAYIVGEKGFRDLVFSVDKRVLVPRPETEHVVEVAVAHLGDKAAPAFCDVGTGSGCVAISVLHEVAAARGIATDVSADALVVASLNAERAQVTDRLTLLEGDLLTPVQGLPDWGQLEAILSNPPYIVRGDADLAPEVLAHEPEAALFVPGDDPLSMARLIACAAVDGLVAGGLLAIEVGHTSGQGAVDMLEGMDYVDVRLLPDLSGIDRVVVGHRPA